MQRKQRKQKKVKIDSGKGLGDTIEQITAKTGIKKLVEVFSNGKDCGCKERKVALNKMFSYKLTARCFTEDEYNKWTEFKEGIKDLKINKQQTDYLSSFYSSLFNVPEYKICLTCPGSLQKAIKFIDNIDKVYNLYKEQLKTK